MTDKNIFLETLWEVAEIARTSDEPLSPEEIHRYFADMDLSEEQEEMIRQYLQKPSNWEESEGADRPGQDDDKKDADRPGSADADRPGLLNDDEEADADRPDDEETDPGREDGGTGFDEGKRNPQMAGGDFGDQGAYRNDGRIAGESEMLSEHAGDKSGSDASLESLSDSAYYRMYLNEVREKEIQSGEQLRELYRKLIAGEDVAGQIADGWLMRVIHIAETYKENPVNMQDLIQEGNIALWMALSEIPGTMAAAEADVYLENTVRAAFEAYIREVTGDVDRTQAMLAKAGLLHEAQEVLARENGQVPSLRELSEYTRISVEEIQSILALYEQKGK